MKIQITPPPPPVAQPYLTVGKLKPGNVFYRKSFGTLKEALLEEAIYMLLSGTGAVVLATGDRVSLSCDTRVVLLDTTLHVSEPNT